MSFVFSSFYAVVSPIRSFHSSSILFKQNVNEHILHLLKKMPKDMSHVPRLQHERQVKKVTKARYPPGTVTLQVLGSGLSGASRALYLFTDQSW